MGGSRGTRKLRSSLSRRVFAGLVVGEAVFALVLGLTVGVFSASTAANQRDDAIRRISATVAAGLMPAVAYQQEPQVRAQLASILKAAAVPDITGICIIDSAGGDIACEGAARTGDLTAGEGARDPVSLLFDEQVVSQPVVVDGLKVAEVRVRFAPPGPSSLVVPAAATALILLAVMLVSLPWTAWLLARDVTQPLEDLERYADAVAEGDLDAPVSQGAYGEIGQLQATLARMGEQLKERDEQLRTSYDDLAAAYASLERASREIERLSEVKSSFVAVAAHEIRGPLTTISLYSELMEGGEMGSLTDASHDAVSAIAASASRLSAIVSDLMDSALLERGLLPVQFRDVSLDALVAEATRDAEVLGRTRGTRLVCETSVGAQQIVADPLRLRQVIDNLLSNAIKYSPEGSKVRVRTRIDEEWAELEVADEGRGIPAGSEDRLFALFGRVDFGDSRETAGLGLGLAISARIAEAHGGRITYRANESGRGSIFTVRLPIGGPCGGCGSYTTIPAAEGGEVA